MSKQITIVTPENVELKFELAGLGTRFVAALSDSIIQFLITLVLILGSIFGLDFDPFSGTLSSWVIALLILLLFGLWGGYFLFFEALGNGQTPGKKSVGIRVIRDTGHPLDFRSAVLRNIMRIVDMLPGMYGVGCVSIFLSPEYRRLGDYAAGTLVVKTQQKPAARPVKPKKEGKDLAPQPEQTAVQELPTELLPQLSSITRDDYRAIRHFLDRRRELEEKVARDLAAKLATPLAQKLQAGPDVAADPVVFLELLSHEWERRMIH